MLTKAERQARYRTKLRAEGIAAYGGKCADCRATESLEFDHIDGRGNEHRHELFRRGHSSPGGWNFLVKLRALGWPPIVELRCTPCHTKKHPGRGNPFGRSSTNSLDSSSPV